MTSKYLLAAVLLFGLMPPGRPIDLDLPELGGRRVSLASYRGKVVLLNLWSTTCPPCRVEIPWLAALHAELGPRGFAVVSISMDDSPERLRPVVQRLGINYPVLLGMNDSERLEEAVGGVWALPTTYILGRDGRVLKKHVGIASQAQLARWIHDALAGKL